eukprot:TRINITY_DN68827_c0_g1_i1.p1 TRINITY_DN68827_c0_g1~~TRINITY_DN68827_c0_g1_i1.p1  ORF type:complete len:1710 (+),score=593.72 TRINITY_DN68827_c0_g1_i1:183-5312(+)
MSSGLLKRTDVFNLRNEGVAQEFINFKCATLNSPKYVCVRDRSGDTPSILIVDFTTDRPNSTRHKISADAAIMNPSSNIIALKDDATQTIQIYNLDLRERLKTTKTPDRVDFWTWIDPRTLAFVTPTAVYHWGLSEGQEPVKFFDRDPELADKQLLHYKVDESMSYALLIGVKKEADGSLGGWTQFWSVKSATGRIVREHAGAFAAVSTPGDAQPRSVMCLASVSAGQGKVSAVEVPTRDRPAAITRVQATFSAPAPGDFPVAVVPAAPANLLYVLLRSGTVHLFSLTKLQQLDQQQLLQEPVFASCTGPQNNVQGVTSKGAVVQVGVNFQQAVQFAQHRLQDTDFALRLASAGGISGVDDLFVAKFNGLLQSGNIQAACEAARDAPNNVLRTQAIIDRLTSMAAADPTQQPAKVYFKVMLEKPPLNAVESVAFARIALARPNGVDFVVGMVQKKQMTPSAELGDMIKEKAPDLALAMYKEVGAKDRVLGSLLAKGDVDAILEQACPPGSGPPNWLALLSQTLNTGNAEGTRQLAAAIHGKYGASAVDPNRVVDMLVQRSHIKPATGYLLAILGDRDAPEDAALQTRLLEVALQYAPPVVPDKILDPSKPYTQYDKQKIAGMCERAGLWHRALEIYARLRQETAADGHLTAIKRCIQNTQALSPDWVEEFFGKLSKEDSLSVLKEMMGASPQGNFKLVVRVASAYAESLGTDSLLELFLEFNAYEAMYYWLQRVVPASRDPECHYRYIEACVRLQNFQEVERMTRESDFYDPERVKSLLKEHRLPDLWPFVNVCDKHDRIGEMVRHLRDVGKDKYIEAYVQKRAPLRLPEVAGALIDCDAPEDYIKNLVMSIGGVCPVGPLVEAFESRNRLRLLRPWLEAQREEGNTDVALFNAIGKILVDTNDRADVFLKTDDHYDKQTLGKYCENRDPSLALICYERGQCDEQIVQLCLQNCMFRQLAQYLVHRQDPQLWAKALAEEDSETRGPLVDAVVNSVLPESKEHDEVITAVRAFFAAQLHSELIDLLEKIVLGPSEFRGNPTLSNVLLQTAVMAGSDRVADLVQRLEAFDPTAVETHARKHGRYEELFLMFRKTGKHHREAVQVLVEDLHSLSRAVEYAQRLPDGDAAAKSVWALVGRQQLQEDQVSDGIMSLIRAQDADAFDLVVAAAKAANEYGDMSKYLQMCRTLTSARLKPSVVDTELVLCLAKTQRLGDLEDFLAQPNSCNSDMLISAGDTLMTDGLYEPARILFQSLSNYQRLAMCLVKLGRFDQAVDAAQKANNVRTWREVCFACVEASEYRLAQSAAWHVIVHADELDAVVNFYEKRGLYDELMAVLAHGLTHERAHLGLYTELGIQFAKHKPEKVIDHVRKFHKRLNAHKLVRVLEQQHLWVAARTTYALNGEHDSAVRVMLEHPAVSLDHDAVKSSLPQVANTDLCYRTLYLYVENFPEQVHEVLEAVQPRLDPGKVVSEFGRLRQLPLALPFLEAVASANLPIVNDALHNLYIDADDFEKLQASVDAHTNFDQVALAQRLEKHEVVEFRRIAARLYKRNNKWRGAIELAQRDRLYKDASEIAAESGNAELVEELLRWFLDQSLPESFAAALATCYDLVRPDVAIELAWRHNVVDGAMPFVVQMVKDYSDRLKTLESKVEALASGTTNATSGGPGGAPPVLAITAGPGGVPPGMPGMPGMAGVPPHMQNMPQQMTHGGSGW